jgi:hypothetical protein
MSLQATLDKISGAAGRIEAALQANAETQSALETANARILELEAAAGAAPDAAQSARILELEGLLEAMTIRATTAEGTVTSQATRITELETSQTDFEVRVNAALSAELAKMGHKPVDTSIKPKDEQKPGANLKGTAAVAAMIKAKREAKK